MNKKFSTLVAAILAAGAWTTASAVDVTPTQFTAAIKENKLSIEDLKKAVEEGKLKWDSKIELTGDVDLTTVISGTAPKYVIIGNDKLVLTTSANAKGVTDKRAAIKGMIFVKGEDVEISNLALTHEIGQANVEGPYQTALKVYADKFTLKNSVLTGDLNESNTTNIVNGVLLYPKTDKAAYTISGNTFKGFAGEVTDETNAPGGAWYSTAVQVYQNTEVTPTGGSDADKYTTAEITFNAGAVKSGNKFEGNDADIFVRNNDELNEGVVEQAYVTYSEDAEEGLKAAVKEAVVAMEKGKTLNFDGSAAELAALTKEMEDVANAAINTNDGLVTPGLDMLKASLEPQNEAYKVDLASSYKNDEYYLLVMRLPQNDTEGDHPFLFTDKDGNLDTKKSGQATAEDIVKDEYLWKVESATPNKDGHIDYVFANKKGVKVALCSANEAAYNKQGVALKVTANFAGVSSINEETVKYFGLYRQQSHLVSAADMNALHNEGFYVSFDKTAGTEAFAGLLEAVGTTDDATEFVLKNEDGDYIKASAKNVTGKNIRQYVYAFELTEKVSEASTFRFWHTPSNVEDNHLLMDKIDSIQVKVRDNKDVATSLDWATLGTYLLTTENTKTLGASIETELNPVSINLTDYTVDPAKFLKNGFAVIKQLREEGDLYVVAGGCDQAGITVAETYANGLEAQWAIAYDADKKEYTMVNRENLNVKSEPVSYFKLRENGDDKDNIYLYGGKEYEITFTEGVDASKNYYKYLSESAGTEGAADMKEKSFVMSYFSTVFDGSANVGINDKGLAFIGTDAEQAEFAAAAVDTVRAKSLINYWDATKKEWAKNEPELKAPVYEFKMGDKKLGLNDDGKVALVNEATQMVIRVAGDKFNLAKVAKAETGKKAAFAGKIYAGNNDSYMYSVNCLYDENKNTLFDVNDNNRPEYRRLGKTVKDGLNDKEGDLNVLKFFRTNDENQFLYENTMNRNAGGEVNLNFLGETNLADKPANAQLPFLVDTAFIRNNTRKPLYMLSVRNTFTPAEVDVPCEVPGHGMDCEHATKGHPAYREGYYLVALDDSTDNVKEATYQDKTRLAFVKAIHEGDSLFIENSEFTGTKQAKNDRKGFVDKDGNAKMNVATFAFKLVDPAVDAEGDKAAFVIEAAPEEGKTAKRYVRIHNTVPVLVDDIKQAAEFEVMAAAEGEEATANEGIEATGVKVVATNGAVIVKGAEGKNVVITNVLGQQVANTVVTSSEATIAAPQGVVVVAVEGEAAVKAIVK